MHQKVSVSRCLLEDVTQGGSCCFRLIPDGLTRYLLGWFQNLVIKVKKHNRRNVVNSCAENDDVEYAPLRFAVFVPNTPMSGHLDDHAFSLLPWRNSWHLIYSSFRPFCAPLQLTSSSLFLRCEKKTSRRLLHFMKQNCFLLLCVLHFSQTSRKPLDPEHK